MPASVHHNHVFMFHIHVVQYSVNTHLSIERHQKANIAQEGDAEGSRRKIPSREPPVCQVGGCQRENQRYDIHHKT